MVAAAAANSMGFLHGDIEKILYSQDAIAEAVSQLGEYVQQLTVNRTIASDEMALR